MAVEKPAPGPSARSLSLTEMILLALVVSVCIYPAFAPFNASKTAFNASKTAGLSRDAANPPDRHAP